MDLELVKKKWLNHKSNTYKKGVLSHLSLADYQKKIVEAGITPEQIGKSSDSYQLCRDTDSGDYTKESCRFDTLRNNIKAKSINGGNERGALKRINDTNTRHGPSYKRKQRHEKVGPKISIEEISDVYKENFKNGKYAHVTQARVLAIQKGYSFISPTGVVYNGMNVSAFSREHGLRVGQMLRLLSGDADSHKGWRKNGD